MENLFGLMALVVVMAVWAALLKSGLLTFRNVRNVLLIVLMTWILLYPGPLFLLLLAPFMMDL